ncbi:MAG: FtsX-like permease family protein, partial [Bacteroidales bacterium]|nr:FtsX-like permease family protein [Candidatus Latescibacterota bacterium]
LRLVPENVAASISHIEELWEKNFPSTPFRYSFFDENFENIYIAEIRLGRLFTFYTTLAMIISSMGLLAMVAYSAERRTREVGVRKALGASAGNLFYLLSSGYVKLVIIATLIAWPIAWYAMARWNDNFAFRAPFAWQFYLLAGGLALLLSILTSVIYTARVCRLNPVDTLRQE